MKIRNPRSEIRILFILLIMVFSFAVQAMTADEYFEFATTKYLQGNLAGAAQDVDQALRINPNHVGARELKMLISEDLSTQPSAATTTIVTTTTLALPLPMAPAAISTTTRPPQVIQIIERIVPQREVARSSGIREKIEEAHGLFLEGEKLFSQGNFMLALEYFRQVEKLLPGHEGSRQYIQQIPDRVKTIMPGLPEKKDWLAEAKARDDWPMLILNGLLTLILLLVGSLILRGIYFWWRSRHTYCPECQTRNVKDIEFCRNCGFRLKLPPLTHEQQEWFHKFYWKTNPFTLNVMPDYFTGHKHEISLIVEKLNTLSGHILIIGGLGTGKSTLLQWLEKHLRSKFETIYVLRPPSRPSELIDLVSATISGQTNHTKKYSVYDFQSLCKNYSRNILLLLDEAHEFNEEFEQFIRTLGDLPNIYLVIAGLPQAREKLKRDLPALFDRIVASILLGSLSLEETKDMILKRISSAGGKGLGPFTLSAVDKIFQLSYGVPRGMLKICDWTVAQAIKDNRLTIDEKDVAAYVEEIKVAKLDDVGPTKGEETSHE